MTVIYHISWLGIHAGEEEFKIKKRTVESIPELVAVAADEKEDEEDSSEDEPS